MKYFILVFLLLLNACGEDETITNPLNKILRSIGIVARPFVLPLCKDNEAPSYNCWGVKAIGTIKNFSQYTLENVVPIMFLKPVNEPDDENGIVFFYNGVLTKNKLIADLTFEYEDLNIKILKDIEPYDDNMFFIILSDTFTVNTPRLDFAFGYKFSGFHKQTQPVRLTEWKLLSEQP